MRNTQRTDGAEFEVPNGEIYRLACCDCGLVHDFVFSTALGQPITIAAKRNNRATAQRRRNMLAKMQIDAETQSHHDAYVSILAPLIKDKIRNR